MHVLFVDNYDSFTYNLVELVALTGAKTTVMRNDEIDAEMALSMSPSHLIISPGPGRPEEAGSSLEIIRALCQTTPTLGICLGHQLIATEWGATIETLSPPVHGKASSIQHNQCGLLEGLPNPVVVGRYHSLVVNPVGLSKEMIITATTTGGTVMAISHRTLPIHGVQFHPESIMTQGGDTLLRNFLGLASTYSATLR